MATETLLGVDGGATKTECALCAPNGTSLALARGGPSNHEVVGYERAAQTVAELAAQAFAQAGASAQTVRAACFSMAGLDLPPDREDIRRHIVAPLGLDCPMLICNDAFAGFRAGSPRGRGICVSLGSGITFCGCNERGESLQFENPKPDSIDGRARKALVAEHYGIGPPCRFRDAYLAALGLTSLEQFLWSLYTNRPYAPKIPREAQRRVREVLFRPEYHDCPVLSRLMDRYAEEIAEILVGLARRLALGSSPFDLVLSGSQLTKGRHPALNGGIIERVRSSFPRAEPVLVDAQPVLGAIRIARELLEAGDHDRRNKAG